MAQTNLREFGFDPGPIDGIYTAQTQAAVWAFQATYGSQCRSSSITRPAYSCFLESTSNTWHGSEGVMGCLRVAEAVEGVSVLRPVRA